MTDPGDEAARLLTYLERRKLSQRQACAVMGIAISALINDEATAQMFLRTLESNLQKSLQDRGTQSAGRTGGDGGRLH